MTVPDSDAAARALLRERQGAGARYDAPGAPAADLLLARRGTSYFARRLNGLSDSGLDGLSTLAGRTRRHVVVDVAFQARRLARLVAAARLDLPVETIVEPELFLEDAELAATLPPHALRHLFRHSEVHLNVEWRDLPEEAWSRSVTALDGSAVAIAATPLIRARSIWHAALELGNGGTSKDLPDMPPAGPVGGDRSHPRA